MRGFNQMTEELESSSRELDRRRRFTEAILESIPTGVISIGADGSIQRVNRALSQDLPGRSRSARATRLDDLFSREDTAEINYLMKRARRTGVAARQFECAPRSRKLHLAVTVAALEEKLTSGFVIVLEDTSELLRAQKAAAWHEVARRVAHEIKNPLTPIALSRRAHRAARSIAWTFAARRRRASSTNAPPPFPNRVESVKTLVDEFSQFARFPAAQPVRCDLNEIVAEALAVFDGRLDGIAIRTSFAPGLPPVNRRPRAVPARGRQSGGQRRRGHAGFAGRRSSTSPPNPAPPTPSSWSWPIPAAASPATTRRSSSCPTSRPRTAAPAWDWRSSATSWPSTTRTIRVEDNQPVGRALHRRDSRVWSTSRSGDRGPPRPPSNV